MKALIVEIRGKKAAALTQNGCIILVKNKNYVVGQKITLSHKMKIVKYAASIAAAVMLFALPAWAYMTPYSYVSLDVNPSFEFSLNRFNRVLDVEAANDDGEEALKEIDINKLKNKEIQDAVKNVVFDLKEEGYLAENEEDGIVIAASSKTQKKTKELSSTIKFTIEELNEKSVESGTEGRAHIDVEVIDVGKEMLLEAKKLGVTPGKLNLVEKLRESAGNPEDFNTEEWLEKPVKDIIKAAKEYKKELKQEDKEKSNNSKEQTRNSDAEDIHTNNADDTGISDESSVKEDKGKLTDKSVKKDKNKDKSINGQKDINNTSNKKVRPENNDISADTDTNADNKKNNKKYDKKDSSQSQKYKDDKKQKSGRGN